MFENIGASWDFPGDPVAETAFPTVGPGFHPWSETRFPHATSKNEKMDDLDCHN